MTTAVVRRRHPGHFCVQILALTFAVTPAFAQLVIVGEATRDLGTFPTTETKTAEFSLRNTGTANATITAARASCGACTTATYPKDAIPPGGVATVTVATKPGRLSGKFQRLVFLDTIPNQQTIRLTIAGEATSVQPDALSSTASPGAQLPAVPKSMAQLAIVGNATRDLGSFPAAESKTAEFSLRNDSQVPATIIAAHGSCGSCTTITYPKAPILPGGLATVTVATKPGRLSGKFLRSVALRTTSGELPFSLVIVGEAIAAPEPNAKPPPTPAELRRQALDRALAIDLNRDGIISPREAKLFEDKQQATLQAKATPSSAK